MTEEQKIRQLVDQIIEDAEEYARFCEKYGRKSN